jgi:hypothetical protein
MMGNFPFGVDNRALTSLDDAVARTETRGNGGLKEFDMCPLKPMILHVVGDLAQEQTIRLQHTISLAGKRLVEMGKIIAILDRRLKDQSKSSVKVF